MLKISSVILFIYSITKMTVEPVILTHYRLFVESHTHTHINNIANYFTQFYKVFHLFLYVRIIYQTKQCDFNKKFSKPYSKCLIRLISFYVTIMTFLFLKIY